MLQITRSSKNLLLSVDVDEDYKVNISGSGSNYKDKTIKKSPFKNLNRAIGYLTPEARLAFT